MLTRSTAVRKPERGSHWVEQPERGGVRGIRTLLAVHGWFGRGAVTFLLYPVVAYFWLTGRKARRASREFLATVRCHTRSLGRAAPTHGSFRHFLEYGQALLDKYAIWGGRFPASDVLIDDPARFEQLRSAGCLFIGSHLGNLEVLRALGDAADFKVNALVSNRHSPNSNRVLSGVNEQASERLIDIDSLGPDAIARLQDKIRAGEHIAILADRVSVQHKGRSVHVPFLGKPAPFPEGPFVIASLLACPVYLLFCVKTAGTYRVSLEPFASPLELPRAERRAALERAVRRYAERLEAHCLLAPTQWFNFFDFWDQADAAPAERRA